MQGKLKRVIFLCREPFIAGAAKFLLDQGIEVSLIVTPEDNKNLYEMIEAGNEKIKDIDLVISYPPYPQRIKMPLINLASRGCINFHPAPLPDYKSRAGYNTAILDGRDWYGVSAHFVDSEEFDAGPIIEVLKFPIDPNENLIDLRNKSHQRLLVLFKKIIRLFQEKKTIDTMKNKGGLYLTGEELEEMKVIDPEKDSLPEIKRKIRAFFFPPYHGATIEIKGERFTLIDKETLKYLAELLNKINNDRI